MASANPIRRTLIGTAIGLATFVACTSGDPATDATSVPAPSASDAASSASASTTIPESAAPTAEGLAEQLTLAERAIRDPATPSELVDDYGRLQQRALRALGGDGIPLIEPTVAALPPDVGPWVERNLAAVGHLREIPSSGPPTEVLPAWRIRPPRPADELLGFYREAEARTGVAWEFLAAINLLETRMGRIVGLSPAGAQGPMQFLPSTWESCCEGDIGNDRDAVIGAATYLQQSGGPDDMDAALFQYNPSRSYVEAIKTYAAQMAEDERAYLGYHAWEVYFSTSSGDVLLPVGYEQLEPVPVDEWLAENPQRG